MTKRFLNVDKMTDLNQCHLCHYRLKTRNLKLWKIHRTLCKIREEQIRKCVFEPMKNHTANWDRDFFREIQRAYNEFYYPEVVAE